MSTDVDTVEAELRVGTLDFALAKLISDQQHTIEFPTILLPENVVAGSIIRLTCSKATEAERNDEAEFKRVQQEIRDCFAANLPKEPVLRARNVTQTSVVLEWDPIQVASSKLLHLELFKEDLRIGVIPDALNRTTTKVSNLEVDSPYKFRLVLSTSAGHFESNELIVQTHKISDLSGVVICLGSLASSSLSETEIEDALKRLNCRPPQDHVNLDTTHFICSNEGGAEYEHANNLNIPIVRPEWLIACEAEKKLVGVRKYYLSVDPTSLPAGSTETVAPTSDVNEEVNAESVQQAANEAVPEETSSQPHEPEQEEANEPQESDIHETAHIESEGREQIENELSQDNTVQDEAPNHSDSEDRSSIKSLKSEQISSSEANEDNENQESSQMTESMPTETTPEDSNIEQPETVFEETEKKHEIGEIEEEIREENNISNEEQLQDQMSSISLNNVLETSNETEADADFSNASKVTSQEDIDDTKESDPDSEQIKEEDKPLGSTDLVKNLENDSKVELKSSEEQHVQISTIEPVQPQSADLTTTEKEETETDSLQDEPLD